MSFSIGSDGKRANNKREITVIPRAIAFSNPSNESI